MRLWLDEMISPVVAAGLRRLGHDVVSVQEPDLRWATGLSDHRQLEASTRQGRVLVTYDIRHFAIIAREWASAMRPHGGILLIHPRPVPQDNTGELTRRLALFLESHKTEDALQDRALFLPPTQENLFLPPT